jgi:hypothetical protein
MESALAEEVKLSATWKTFGFDHDKVVGEQVAVRQFYVAASRFFLSEALNLVLASPKAVRGLLLIDPRMDSLPTTLVSRIHAVRCPGIILGDSIVGNNLMLCQRMPNMVVWAENFVQQPNLSYWQRIVENLPYRNSMKSKKSVTTVV